MSDSMFSAAFDVLIKILESYRPQILSNDTSHNEPSKWKRPTGSVQGSSYPPRLDRRKRIIVEQESDSEDEEEQVTADPNPEKYKPPVPYPQALNRPKAKNNETDDHLLDAFKKVTITIPLIDAIKHIPSYAKFLKCICTPHRNPRMIQLSETVSSIIMNSLPIKKRDPGAPMITSEI